MKRTGIKQFGGNHAAIGVVDVAVTPFDFNSGLPQKTAMLVGKPGI